MFVMSRFETVARKWLALQEKRLAPAILAKAGRTFETPVFPYIGSRPIAKLGAEDVLQVLKHIEGRAIHETAHRTRQVGKMLILLLCGVNRQAGSIPIGAATPCFDGRGLQNSWSIFNVGPH